MTISDMIDVIGPFDPLDAAKDAFLDNSDEAVKLNRSQLMRGETSEDEEIMPQYAGESYAGFKHNMNSKPPFSTPDLYLSGAFQEAFFVDVSAIDESIFEISSNDDKLEELIKKYSPLIFGLDTDSHNQFLTLLLNSFSLILQQRTGLTL